MTRMMKYGYLAGVDGAVSRIALGTSGLREIGKATSVFEEFVAAGGNFFDTAHIYGGGASEAALGLWVQKRGIRDQVVILAKGAHTPFCTPEQVAIELDQSLERLKTEKVDLYMLHRDNEEVPVAEFLDALIDLNSRGIAHAFGMSNWSFLRIREAHDILEKRRGGHRITGISNNLALSRMVDPLYPGCVSIDTAEFRAWLARTGISVIPWSSQGRRYFSVEDTASDSEVERCWSCGDNAMRRLRAKYLARQLQVAPINVALAYVLHQPMSTFPIVGCQTVSELKDTLGALSVSLTKNELDWLDVRRWAGAGPRALEAS